MHARHFNYFPSMSAYALHVHELNHIWWYTEEGVLLNRDQPEMIMLQVSELAEALEGDRKDLMDDHLLEFKMFPVELADTAIRALDFAGAYRYDLSSPINLPLIERPKTIGGKLLNLASYSIGIAHSTEIDHPQCAANFCAALIHGCADLARAEGYNNFWDIVLAKLLYNQKRADHQYEARAKANGKKY